MYTVLHHKYVHVYIGGNVSGCMHCQYLYIFFVIMHVPGVVVSSCWKGGHHTGCVSYIYHMHVYKALHKTWFLHTLQLGFE